MSPTTPKNETNHSINDAHGSTLMENIEQVVDAAINSKLSDSVYTIAQRPLEYLKRRTGLQPKQALLFSLFMELSHYDTIRPSQLASLTDCRHVRILSLLDGDQTLINRRLIRRVNDDNDVGYRVPKDVISAIMNDRAMVRKRTQLTIDEFFERISVIIEDAENSYDNLFSDIYELVYDNLHLAFCKAFKKHFGPQLHREDSLLFMVFAHLLVNEENDCVGEHSWDSYFSRLQVRLFRRELTEKTSYLLNYGLLEEMGGNGMRDNYYYRISDNAKKEFFAEIEGLITFNTKIKELQSYKVLAKKQLFYNDREEGQITQLSSLLSHDNFLAIQQRLEASGMRKGFACLFYGAPGTGKTETVYQLARRTKRDLFVIDVAKIKSCWVGESEKNITQAFANYRNCVKNCNKDGKNIPILLFNEADAVLGIRKEGAESAVDKMENSIQNIILQELERLDGILIATTNLTSNLDKAFERRFIYKIEFEKPTIEARCAIWKSMIPYLHHNIAQQLASDFDFTGGQIENVARKRAIDLVLTGKSPSTEQLYSYCEQEHINDKKHTKIGF